MRTHRLTRRSALRWLGAGGGLALLAACGDPTPAAPTPVGQSVSKPAPQQSTSGRTSVAPVATIAATTASSGSL
jgi:hypothetical protein